jgi:hypothetical protein
MDEPQKMVQQLQSNGIISEQGGAARDFCSMHNINFEWAFDQ